jgi:hypothetical protein
MRDWPVPMDAKLFLTMHTMIKSFKRGYHHAEATVFIPVSDAEFQSFSVAHTSKTERGAWLKVISEIENSTWFHHFRKRGVRFKVSGPLEKVYRGYL